MTLVQLKQLWRGLLKQPTGKMPHSLSELGPALVRHCCSDISEQRAQEFWKKRDAPEFTPLHSPLEPGGNDECCKDLVEDDELHAIREKKKDKKETGVAKAAPPASASSSSSSAPAKASSRKLEGVTLDWEKIEIADLRSYWPPEAQCGVSREFTHATRWKAVCPTRAPPRSFSMVYGDKSGEKRSVMACLQWLWQSHKDATGKDCPWDWQC